MGHFQILKGSCHGQLSLYMWESLFFWVQRHDFYPKLKSFPPPNHTKTKNPGTSIALKSGYPEEYCALKTGYPEEHWALKTGYRKDIVHWKQTSRKRNLCRHISFPGILFSVHSIFPVATFQCPILFRVAILTLLAQGFSVFAWFGREKHLRSG